MILIHTYKDISTPKTIFTFFINYSVYSGPEGKGVLSKFSSERAWLTEYPYYKVRTR